MKFALVISAFLSLIVADRAHALPCIPSDAKLISDGLTARSKDSTLSEEQREAALFVNTVISNARNQRCRKESGFAGNAYAIETPTHKISINFVGSSISTLEVKRTKFN